MKADKMFFISLPRMGEGWWFCSFSAEEAEKKLRKESAYESNQKPASSVKLTLMEWDVAPLKQYIVDQASRAWFKKEEFGRRLPPGYRGDQSYYEIQGKVVSYFHLPPDLLPIGEDNHFNGFVVVDWLKENFPPVSNGSIFDEIRIRINFIKDGIKNQKEADFDFVKSAEIEIESEAMWVMSDCAFSSSINPQMDKEKRMIMEEYHPLYKGISVSFSALTYIRLCGKEGFRLSAAVGYSEQIGADNLVEYLQPGYGVVWMDKEFWVVKIDDPRKAVMGNMGGDPYTHHIYKVGSALLIDAEKLHSLREAGVEVIVIM